MKLKINENESSNLIVLTEKSLNRLVKQHHITGYVIMSACSGLIRKNGDNVKLTDDNKYLDIDTNEYISKDELLTGQALLAANNKRNRELITKAINHNYSFLPVLGGYRHLNSGAEVYEKSIVIFPFDRKGNPLDLDTIIDFCKDEAKTYNQESILINAPDERPYYWNYENDEISMVFSNDINSWDINDLTKEFFTALKQYDNIKYPNYKGKPQRFTMTEVYLTSQPQTIMGAHSRSSRGELCLPLIVWNK